MDYSPSKRRKTSPISSIDVNQQSTQRLPASHDADRPSSGRVSFMSPTKASLARFHTSLLPLNDYSITQREVGNSLAGFVDQRNSAKFGLHELAAAGLGSLEIAENGSTPMNVLNTDGQTSSVASRCKSTTPISLYPPSNALRTTIAEDTRASPPEEAREEDNEVPRTSAHDNGSDRGNNAEASRTCSYTERATLAILDSNLPATPIRSGTLCKSTGMVLDEDGVPSLPSTPIHLGLEKPPESPKGLLYSGVGKKLREKRLGSANSSPLKQQTVTSAQSLLASSSMDHSLGPRLYITDTPRPPPSAQEVTVSSMRDSLARLEKQIQQDEGELIHQLLVSEWESTDGKVVKEISRRKKEIASKSAKVIRLRQELQQTQSSDAMSGNRPTNESSNQISSDQFLEGEETFNRPGRALKPASLSQRLSRFLPFSERLRPPIPKPPSPRHLNAFDPLDLDMLVSGEMALTMSSSDIDLLDETPEDGLLQRQIIHLSSMSSLLNTRLLVIVNLSSHMVTQLQVLELSSWAEKEFGGWLRTLRGNVNLASLGLTLAHYSKVCLDRFRCWNQISQDFSALFVNGSVLKILPLPTDDADYTQITQDLGRQECTLTRDAVTLNFAWYVSITDEGGVQCDVKIYSGFPEKWQRLDVGTQLSKIGEVFDMLKQEKGITQAISLIARLIFPV